MKSVLFLTPFILMGEGFAFAPTADQCAVSVQWPDAFRKVLVVTGQTYRMEIQVQTPSLAISRDQESPFAQLMPEGARLGKTPVRGPGRINIYNFGTQMYEIHLRDLKADGFEKGEIELALFCYAQRVFASLNVRRYDGTPAPKPSLSGLWIENSLSLASSSDAPLPVDQVLASDRSELVLTLPSLDAEEAPAKSDTVVFLVGGSPQDLGRLYRQEVQPEGIVFDLSGGHLDGYQKRKGFYQITTEYAGPRGFEEGWINPNQRYEVDLDVKSPFPSDILCNVRNTYGVLEGSVLADEHGFPLPVQVQVCKNFGGEFEEGREEGDVPYGEAYFPLSLGPDKPFKGHLYHLFGNWGTHPLKQISSIRFFHHYFHASLGPTETFCYVPFEYPREDDRDYILADVRGLSNFAWPGQPQHDHVSVIGALRYKSEGRWINNLLQDTRIYLTSPNLASCAMDYLSEDRKVKTTLEIFEVPQDDEARSYIRMKLSVLEDVAIDGASGQNLRFLNAGAYIVQTRWSKLAYTASSGETRVLDVPSDNTWVLQGEPLGPQAPFAAAYPHKNGNMCFFVAMFKGKLGGKEVPTLGLSCFGGQDWTEMFLTAPGSIEKLQKGDEFDAHLFVMPYGHADVDYKPAERQRALYGEGLAKVEVTHGKAFPGYPRRIQADSRGFARFKLTGGDNWTPFLVEGFPSHKAPMLWEERGGWVWHDQQVNGNDWVQAYRAEDGAVGFVFVVKVRPGQTHDYLVALAPNATSITQRNGFVTVRGGPMDFVSPVPFKGLQCQKIPDTGLYRCVGDADEATSLQSP